MRARLTLVSSTAVVLAAGLGCTDQRTPPTAPDVATVPAPLFGKPTSSSVVITDLGLSGSDSRADEVNASGQVAGWRGDPFSASTAFLWTPTQPRGSTGTARVLPSLGGNHSLAWALNDAGEVAGESSLATGEIHAVVWHAAGGILDLGLLPGSPDAEAMDIAEAGTVIVGGDRLRGGGAERPIAWTLSGSGSAAVVVRRDVLLPLVAGMGSWALAVDPTGNVAVGYSGTADGQRAVVWTRGLDGSWRLPQAIPIFAGGSNAVARGVNSNGQVVGDMFPPSGCGRAFVWSAAAGMRELGSSDGCGASAEGINNAGQIVGMSTDKRGIRRAAIWTVDPSGTVTSLRQLDLPTGSRSAGGMGVSQSSGGVLQVAGYAISGSGRLAATLWTLR
jgi:uncharacterized membrane protein